jgi:iron complex outermembrane recepter protein
MKPSVVKLGITLLVLLLGASIASGQTKQLLTYRDGLDTIQKLTGAELEDQQDSVIRIRTGIEFWIRLHPDTTIKLEAAPDQPWKSEQMLKEVKLLRDTLEEIIKEDRGQSFNLGRTEISVTGEASPLSPVTDSIDGAVISDLHVTNIAQALQYLPGLALDRKSSRNQTGIMIRGYDSRQVGLYLDGIPIYVPYDGYADMSRSLSSDIAVIETAKGYSSPLLGPNGLGGTINIVTKQPEKLFEGDAQIGTGSGQMLESGAHFGSRFGKFFIRGGMDWLQTNYVPISGKFTINSLQPTFKRINSDQRDVRYGGRIGWTPKGEDQYVFTYTKQKSENNVPHYAGIDTANNTVQYRLYDYWNRDSYYFNSNTGLGEKSSLKFRAFYDKYPNAVSFFSNASHQARTGFSPYDDYSGGFSSEFSSRMISRNALGASFFFKDDSHKAQDISYTNGAVSLTKPWILDRDRLVSLGFQDAINILSGLRATAGFSIDYLNGITAQDVDPATNSVVPFPCTKGTVTAPCALPDNWAFNPLASLSYSIADSGTAFFTFAKKSHFPTLKDRFSTKMGKAVPSPELEAEHARNFSFGYSHAFSWNTLMQIELFRADVYDAITNVNVPEENPSQCTGTTCSKALNAAKEMHQGMEFSVRSSPIRRLNLTANYTLLKRTITGPANMPPVFPQGTPKHRIVSTATIHLPREFLLLASTKYESGAFNVNKINVKVPASKYATLDLAGLAPLYSGASFQAGVKNLFDRNYYYEEGYPEAGRTWYTNLHYRF